MKTVRKNSKTNPDKRVTICVYRGLPKYRDELKSKLKNIKKYYPKGKSPTLVTIIEKGINLALVECGETSISADRLQGRYTNE